jgi:hypothetical protein
LHHRVIDQQQQRQDDALPWHCAKNQDEQWMRLDLIDLICADAD